ASSATSAFVRRLLDINLHLLLRGGIFLIFTFIRTALRQRIIRGRQKSREIPTGMIFAEALSCQISILRAWPNEIAAECVHELGTNVDRLRHERLGPSKKTMSFSAWACHFAV